MDNKYIKILIPIFIVLIIIIILIILLILNIQKKDENEDYISIGDPGEEIDYSNTEIHTVSDKIEYYTVRNCINNYLNYINQDSSIYYVGDEIDTESQKEYIYSVLSSEFIKDNNITKSNVLNKIDIIHENYTFVPLQMKSLEKENVNKYVVYGTIQSVIENTFIKESYFIVNLDIKNKTYSIEPITKQYDSIDEIKIENNNISIESNENNNYRNQKITNEYVTGEYLLLYKRLVISKPEIIFNMMTKEYREARFGNLNNFKKYITDNSEEIEKITLKEYLVNNYENYIEYVGKDQFGNLYIFNENNEDQSIDIKLDTYTITPDTFIEEYEKAKEEKRVQMNIDKFIQMINRHDYITSYNCISQGFKNNYFKTQSEFEDAIKNNFFEYNKLEFINFEKSGSNVYVYTIQISDLTGESSELRKVKIIMQLNEDLDFEMSFGM